MKIALPLWLALAIFFSLTFSVSAAVYRWVDQDGKVHFGDQAPEGTQAQKVTVNPALEASPTGGTTTPEARPAETGASNAPRSFPKVEVYTTSWCPWCKKAVAYLQANGVPYTEYDVEKDQAAAAKFKSLNPRGGVPFAIIGDQKISGFDTQSYAQALGIQGQ